MLGLDPSPYALTGTLGDLFRVAAAGASPALLPSKPMEKVLSSPTSYRRPRRLDSSGRSAARL